MNKIVVLLAGLIVMFTTACGPLNKKLFTPEGSLFGDGRVNIASANQMIDSEFEGFDDTSLQLLLDPGANTKNLEQAFFYANYNMIPSGTVDNWDRSLKNRATFLKARRSQIQDRLIAASNQRCNIYATHLKKVSSSVNGFFGIATTALAGAGSIVTGAEAARILAGLAGISSGSRAELNQALFETVTTSVIIPGFKKRREEILKEILKKRSKGIDEYTVEGAVADAIKYHGACSLDEGVAQAQKSIVFFGDIGLERLKNVQNEIGIIRKVSESLTDSMGNVIVASTVLKDFVNNLNEYKKKATNPSDLFTEIENHLKQATKQNNSEGEEYLKKASELDEALQKIMLEFASTSGIDRHNSLIELEKQQKNTRDFQNRLEVIEKGILGKLPKE